MNRRGFFGWIAAPFLDRFFPRRRPVGPRKPLVISDGLIRDSSVDIAALLGERMRDPHASAVRIRALRKAVGA